jgi:3-phenylpropionate/trans-cinnamate dioxygenase ferredoxin subunit
MNETDTPRQICAGPADELAPGNRKLLFVNGRSIVLLNIEGTLHAIDNACPHNGASIANGKLEGNILRCPAHGMRIDLTADSAPRPGCLRAKSFPVTVANGRLMVQIEDAPCNETPQC